MTISNPLLLNVVALLWSDNDEVILKACQHHYMMMFVVADTNTIKDAVLSGSRPQLYFIPADVPDILKQVVTNCWAQHPKDRPLFCGL